MFMQWIRWAITLKKQLLQKIDFGNIDERYNLVKCSKKGNHTLDQLSAWLGVITQRLDITYVVLLSSQELTWIR